VRTTKYARKPLYVDAVCVTEANADEVAKWCSGEKLIDSAGDLYIKTDTNTPMTPRQTRAYVGDWMLKSPRGFKIYTQRAFEKSFDLVK